MRRVWIFLLAGLLLTACGGGDVTIPTAAQLPSATPSDGGGVFVTDTPDPDTEAVPAGETSQPPTEAPQSAFSTPTPETLADSALADGQGGGGACTTTDQDAVLAQVDPAALQAALQSQVADLTAQLDTLGAWTFDPDTDPFSSAPAGGIPMAGLRFAQGDALEAFILISPAPDPIGDFLDNCLADDAYYLDALPPEATVTITPLEIGDASVKAVITEPAGDIDGIDALETHIYSVLVGDTLLQYVTLPALEEASGIQPVPEADALDLLAGLAQVVEG